MARDGNSVMHGESGERNSRQVRIHLDLFVTVSGINRAISDQEDAESFPFGKAPSSRLRFVESCESIVVVSFIRSPSVCLAGRIPLEGRD